MTQWLTQWFTVVMLHNQNLLSEITLYKTAALMAQPQWRDDAEMCVFAEVGFAVTDDFGG